MDHANMLKYLADVTAGRPVKLGETAAHTALEEEKARLRQETKHRGKELSASLGETQQSYSLSSRMKQGAR